jgi:poly(glycerol-phosphate) alpha-glucosyltransferase
VRSLVRELRNTGAAAEVFAGWDAYIDEDRNAWSGVPLHVLSQRGPSIFGWLPDLNRQLSDFRPDVIHTHGLWMYPSVSVLRVGRHVKSPWIVSARGMLDPWALRNAQWKKRLAGLLYEKRHLHGAACLHALCDAEAAAFREYGLKNPIAVVSNGVHLPQLTTTVALPEWAQDLPKESRVLLFLGRLHPKKGLLNLLRAWARRSQATAAPWVLVIAGWDQNDHRAELERMRASLGIDHTVRFVGSQCGEQKAASLMRADAFVLPSFSEGLPMAVLEAWAYRLPVLMTPECNLPEGFAAGAAIESAPEVESLSSGLDALFGMSETALSEMGARGRSLVEYRFTWARVAGQMCEVYAWVLGEGPQPDCVFLE